MIDPVSGFPYPEAWVRLCTDEAARDLARSGFGVLMADGTVLRRGFTTRTTAAAFAAVASLHGAEVSEAEVLLPYGIRATPRYLAGEPVISPQARAEILGAIAVSNRLTGVAGAEVILWIPEGARIGALTLNPQIDVLGGISVVGTTGFVEPWDDHLTVGVAFAHRICCSLLVVPSERTGGVANAREACVLFQW